MTAYWITGDTRRVMAQLPAGSVDLVLTSPPFLALRSYLPDDDPAKVDEIGSEANPAEFIDTLLDVTEACARLLAPHGTLCVELGDTYSGSGGAGGDYKPGGWRAGQPGANGSSKHERTHKVDGWGPFRDDFKGGGPGGTGWPLPKSLALIPEAYRMALAYGRNPHNGRQTDPWRIRNVIRWVRPNPPVGALGDKFRPATSEMVVACKSGSRWFDLDAVRQPFSAKTEANLSAPNSVARSTARAGQLDNSTAPGTIAYGVNPAGAPPLDWWKISPGGYDGAHYATWPPELCVRPIEAMCPRRVCRTCGKPSRRLTGEATYVPSSNPSTFSNRPAGPAVVWESGVSKGLGAHTTKNDGGMVRVAETTGWSTCGCPGSDGIRLDGYHTGTGWRAGVVLDPFGGSGTTASVASGHSRDSISIDLDRRNADLARARIGMWFQELEPTDLGGAA